MQRTQRWVLIVAILASFVAFLDGSVVNVALPAIARDLGGGLVTQQWVVDAYLITLGACMLVAGSFADVWGRKKILIIGLVGFLATSLLAAAAPNAPFLIVARAFQGLAGAFLVPSSLALIISAFSGKAEGKAIGVWTAWTGIAFVIGPLLGGFLVDSLSWRWIFAINVLPISFTLWVMRHLGKIEDLEKNAPIDIKGAILCTLSLGGPVYALIEQSHYGWTNPLIYTPFIGGLILLVLFIWYERRTPHAMLPLSLFNVRNFSVGNIATAAIYAGLSVATFLIAVFVQQVGGYSALKAGMSLLPVTLIMFALSPRFGALADNYGPRLFMASGPIIAGAGFLLMTQVTTSLSYWTQLFPGIVMFGLGLSITVSPLTTAILGAIEPHKAGIASAVNNAVARIAGLIAIAGIGLVTGSTFTVQSFRRGVIATALLLITGGLISAVGIQNKTRPKKVATP